ncbi:MAG TPA: adenylate/guanylate cyclase, partial [Pirellulaceae bacterium]|nr:adenylate/guanylate cyclase [Pirellulaceae bacterium]
ELAKLMEAEVLLSRGRGPRTTYVFKHALIQDAAYGSLIKSKRRELHQRIAEVLENDFSDLARHQPELLALHFTEAGETDKAIDYWARAGARSLERRAHKEAIQHLRYAIELLSLQPETDARWRREVELQTQLGVPLQATIGYSAPEVHQTYARAHELCMRLGLTTAQFPVLYGMFRYYMLQANYRTARELGSQLLTIADQTRVPHYVVAANRARGAPPVYEGRHTEALPFLQAVIAIQPSSELRTEVNRYDVVDPWIAARSYLSWATWLLGYPEQSMRHSAEAVRIAEGLGHSFSIALAVSFSQWVHQFRRDVVKTRAAAERALATSREHGFAFWYGWCGIMRGWAIAQQSRGDEAIAEIRQGIADWRAQGSELGSHYYYILLAEACLACRRFDEARTSLDDAQRFARETGEGFYLPELYRLSGRIALQSGPSAVSDAESAFRESLELARAQQAKSLELRAAVDLASLLTQRGDRAKAIEQLAPLAAWFSEGDDTSDVGRLRKQLAELKAM